MAGELRALVSDDERVSLKASTPNAHYTPPVVIEALWAGVQRLGVRGSARVLEPAGPSRSACGGRLRLAPRPRPRRRASFLNLAEVVAHVTARGTPSASTTASVVIEGQFSATRGPYIRGHDRVQRHGRGPGRERAGQARDREREAEAADGPPCASQEQGEVGAVQSWG